MINKEYVAEMKIWIRQQQARKKSCQNCIKIDRETIKSAQEMIALEQRQIAIINRTVSKAKSELEKYIKKNRVIRGKKNVQDK